MSYLCGPRLAFRGRFLADVPTRNNAGPAYDPEQPVADRWNPVGGGTFDLLDCRVTGGESGPGQPVGPETLALAVRGAADRAAAKMVDLDPDWQLSSQLWGLRLRVVDPATGEDLVSGEFRVSAFRELFARQVVGVATNGQGSTGAFASVLEDVRFGAGCTGHPVLDALRPSTVDSRLAVVLNLFGFYYNHVEDRFGTGGLTGCLGAWQRGEPRSYVPGRRLDAGPLPGLDPPVLVGRATAAVDPDAARLTVDLGSAWPIVDPDGTPLRTAFAVEAGFLADDTSTAAVPVGEILLDRALDEAGVFSFPLAPDALAAARRQPIALLARHADGSRTVIAREVPDGLYVRAEDFVRRLDAGTSTEVTVHATRHGVPAAGVTVRFLRAAGAGSVLTVPAERITGAAGTVTLPLTAADPGSPRPVDGVVETVAYSARRTAAGQLTYAGTGLDAGVDRVVVHVRSAFTAPPEPDWERDVRPVLARYARLYPVMGQHLADLGDLAAIRPYRAAMLLAMTRDIADPNHMPVTRDLSGPKHAMIVRWLEQLDAAPGPPPVDRPPADVSRAAAEDVDVKAATARAVFRRALPGADADADDGDEG